MRQGTVCRLHPDDDQVWWNFYYMFVNEQQKSILLLLVFVRNETSVPTQIRTATATLWTSRNDHRRCRCMIVIQDCWEPKHHKAIQSQSQGWDWLTANKTQESEPKANQQNWERSAVPSLMMLNRWSSSSSTCSSHKNRAAQYTKAEQRQQQNFHGRNKN